jgi:inorganic triphosphatase YgiF
VPTPEALRRLAGAPLPLGLRDRGAERRLMRDLYFDTPDRALRARGATCRFRLRADDRRELTVALVEDARGGPRVRRARAEVRTADAAEAFAGPTEAARLLRALVAPAALDVALELEVERHARAAGRGPWDSRLAFHFDALTVRAAGLARAFQELPVRELRRGRPGLGAVADAVAAEYALRAESADPFERGTLLRAALES